MPQKNRILLYGALALCTALYAVPQLAGPGTLPFLGAAGATGTDSELPVDDGFFASGFDGVTPGSASPGDAASLPSRGLAAQLEQALQRMERVDRGSSRAIGAQPSVELRVEPKADSGASATSRARDEFEARAREALQTYLARHPVRGAILGGSGSALLLDGIRLGVGDTLGQSGWILAEVDHTGAVFSSGHQRVRADLPRGPRASIATAVPAGAQGGQQ
ncbi:MAG: hypothetical protein GC161_02230 [Planctomycetaceae bacterium]|nr:hypothetical protein [Planctomycetaceae bacterium]